MNLKLDDIANTLKDIQQPCIEKSVGGIDKRFIRLEDTIEQMANDISKIKTKQTEMEEEILENRKHANTKYQELNADANEIKERLNENRQYTITKIPAKIHELKVQANDNTDATNAKHRELKQSVEELKQGIGETSKQAVLLTFDGVERRVQETDLTLSIQDTLEGLIILTKGQQYQRFAFRRTLIGSFIRPTKM